jgi:hypothetical protein
LTARKWRIATYCIRQHRLPGTGIDSYTTSAHLFPARLCNHYRDNNKFQCGIHQHYLAWARVIATFVSQSYLRICHALLLERREKTPTISSQCLAALYYQSDLMESSTKMPSTPIRNGGE